MKIPTPPPRGCETPTQVADRLGVPVSTVYSWLNRELLKKRVGWCGNRIAIDTKEVDALIKHAKADSGAA